MKPRFQNTSWRILRVPAYILGAFALAFFVLVMGKLVFRAAPVRAASSILYPSFCLGGWLQAQNAAAAPDLKQLPPSSYDENNSAFLASGVASQIFCGYFKVSEKTNPPARVVISFNWDMRDTAGQGNASSTAPAAATSTAQDSYTSNSQYLVSPATGFIVPVPTTTPETASSTAAVPTAPAQSDASSSTPATGTDVTPAPQTQSADATPPAASSDASPASSGAATSPTTPVSAPPPASDNTPASAPATDPAPAAAPAAAPASSDGTTSYLMPLLSLIAPVANGSTDEPSFTSNAAFLSVSYSTDGVRWTQIGTVGRDNWKDYKVAVPVSSWDDVNHLQIQLSVIPTIDTKPDIYLESISAKADYSRTVAEALLAAAGSASDAADELVNKILDVVAPVPEPQKKPDPVHIFHKKLLVSKSGAVIPGPRSDIAADPDTSENTLVISGNCSKKYFVILVYRNKGDYAKNPASYVANEARECANGRFSYSLSSLSPEIRSGGYYLLTGEEDETGPWKAVSGLFPISIQATTTVETVDPSRP